MQVCVSIFNLSAWSLVLKSYRKLPLDVGMIPIPAPRLFLFCVPFPSRLPHPTPTSLKSLP